MDKKISDKKTVDNARRIYPGAAIDDADREKVNAKTVKQDTEMLNCNPRGVETDAVSN